jgi:hypothetical protein
MIAENSYEITTQGISQIEGKYAQTEIRPTTPECSWHYAPSSGNTEWKNYQPEKLQHQYLALDSVEEIYYTTTIVSKRTAIISYLVAQIHLTLLRLKSTTEYVKDFTISFIAVSAIRKTRPLLYYRQLNFEKLWKSVSNICQWNNHAIH